MRWWTFELGREGPVSGWRVDMTAFARFSMASRLMRDATNLAGSQGCSARLRKQDTGHTGTHKTAQRLDCTSSSRSTLFAHRSDPSCFVPCIYSCLPTCLRILRYRPGAPSETSTLSLLYRRFMHACDLCSPGRLPNHRQTSELDPVSPVTNQVYVHTLRVLEPASIDRRHP